MGRKRGKKDGATESGEIELPARPVEKASRKRAADSFEGDNGATKPSKVKGEKPSKKAKLSDESLKPSKVDGHPVATAKTVPGGDMIEVEPPKTRKSKKDKGAQRDKPVASSNLQETEGLDKGKRSKRSSGKAEVAEAAEHVPATQDKQAPNKASKAPKTKKAKEGPTKAATNGAPVDATIVPNGSTDEARVVGSKTGAKSKKSPDALKEPKAKQTEKSKKRKVSEEVPRLEVNMEDGLVDTGTRETTTSRKKTKKASDESIGLVGKISQGVNAAVSTIGNVLENANKSIAEDVTEVAEGVVEIRADDKRTKQSRKKSVKNVGESRTVNEGQDKNDDLQGFNDNNGSNALVEENESSDEQDDQTMALLKGFESGSEEDASGDEGFKEGQPVPKLPQGKQLSKQLKKIKATEDDEPGVIYVGRIPHGFHEHEMRAYFSQFGTVNHVRLSRNKKTGNSKHYAFLEFASSEVARIVANTMDNYLMFGHILKCKFVPQEQVHPKMWIGADRRFKKVPWNKIEGRKLALPKGKAEWEKKNEVETKRRREKAEKLKAIGYEFEGPELKSPHDVPMEETAIGAIEEPIALQTDVVEAKTTVVSGGGEHGAVVVSEEVKTRKRGRKGKTQGEEKTEGKAEDGAVPEEGQASSTGKVLKALDSAVETAIETVEAAGERLVGATKKAKKVVGDREVTGGKKAKKSKKAAGG